MIDSRRRGPNLDETLSKGLPEGRKGGRLG